jgi:hypothetical protein
MALQKEIELKNGVTLNYHRVVSVNSITNISTTIEVAGYVNEAKRLEEKTYQELQMKEDRTPEEEEELERGINVYIDTDYIQIPYDKNMNVDNAYEYLLTTDKYKNARNC